eukprot:NODE_3306_length_1001_cov_28.216387_g3040_i0.p1 GENE.NODE_3306_length_1001_cov_28.216387_g3040_i0~~NODE_3306_length_1001_cov_28.216387_g3040_i0.p1  ORF type:complete len:288 (-),score=30.74 NODE_3306_length_1001_cov_28.216387_g3040_i0:94-957(-)
MLLSSLPPSHHIAMPFLRVLAGAVIGFCVGLTSIGGGLLVIPFLTVGLGLPPTIAVGTASLYTFLTKIFATFRHARLGNFDRQVFLIFCLGSVPGTFLGSTLVSEYAADARSQFMLRWLTIAVMVGSLIVAMLNISGSKPSVTSDVDDDDGDANGDEGGHSLQWSHGWKRRLIGCALAFGIGLIVGATAVGAGVISIPTMISLFQLSAREAVGTSTSVGLVLTLISSIVYSKTQLLDLNTALLMAVGSLVGVFFGSRAAAQFCDRTLRKIVVGIISLSIMLMLVSRK